MPHPTFTKTAMGIAASVLLLSCSFLESAASQGTDSTGSGGLAEVRTLEDPRVEEAFALRSVRMQLETTFPGKGPNRALISIDAGGNQKIEMTIPKAGGSADGSDTNVVEIFVIDGKAYTRMGKDEPAEPDPLQDDALRGILYSPTGPGMWLLLLPEESFTSAGTEDIGGFQATRYSVEGSIEEGFIRGEIWSDAQTGALIGADLAVSESLFYAEGSATGGSVSITLTVEKAEVPAITLPE